MPTPVLPQALLCIALFPAIPPHDTAAKLAQVTARIRKAPADMRLRLMRAELCRSAGRMDVALRDVTLAIERAPELLEGRMLRARILYQLRRPGDALRDLDGYLRARPQNGEAKMLRGRCLLRLRRPGEAARELRAGIESLARRKPSDYLDLANALASLGPMRIRSAIGVLDRGLRELGPAVAIQERAIELELASGSVSCAVARIDRITALAERKEHWLVRRASVLFGVGDVRAARQVARRALREIRALPPRLRRGAQSRAYETRLNEMLASERGER